MLGVAILDGVAVEAGLEVETAWRLGTWHFLGQSVVGDRAAGKQIPPGNDGLYELEDSATASSQGEDSLLVSADTRSMVAIPDSSGAVVRAPHYVRTVEEVQSGKRAVPTEGVRVRRMADTDVVAPKRVAGDEGGIGMGFGKGQYTVAAVVGEDENS